MTPPVDPTSKRAPGAAETLVDRGFRWASALAAIAVLLLLLGIIFQIGSAAWPAVQAQGTEFITTDTWDGKEKFGVRPQIFGTLTTAVIAVGIASAFGLAIAIFLTQGFLPERSARFLTTMIEILAAIPSVVYGLWGIFVVIPAIRPLCSWLHEHLGGIALFGTRPLGPGLLPASLVLAVMILPTIAAVSRSALSSVSRDVRNGALALGATRWEAILKVVLPSASRGIWGSIVLGFGRAVGETMALAMLIGNSPTIGWSLFAPADTLAAMLANRFPEAGTLEMGRLMYAALVLLALTMVVNAIATWILSRTGSARSGRAK